MTPAQRRRLAATVQSLRAPLLAAHPPHTAHHILHRALLLRIAPSAPPELLPCPPIPAAVTAALSDSELSGCWQDPLVLGWAHQYWNDPRRQALDARLRRGGRIAPEEVASKTQLFTERYLVSWILQNTLGPVWFGICEANGWAPECAASGLLASLEDRRSAWRASTTEPTVLMPLGEDEARWGWLLGPPRPVSCGLTSLRGLRLLDPAVGSGHFLLVALELLVPLYEEEARHRGADWPRAEIVSCILSDNLCGVDIDADAVAVAAAALWLRGQQLGGVDAVAEGLVAAPDLLGTLRREAPSPVTAAGYHIVVGNPPYQGTAKLRDPGYVRTHYPLGRSDLYAAFLIRSLELVCPGGLSGLLTLRGWMFTRQHTKLRTSLLAAHQLWALCDVDTGAFAEISGEVVRVCASIFRRTPPDGVPCPVLDLTGEDGPQRTRRKRASARCQRTRASFVPSDLAAIPGQPLVYGWDAQQLRRFLAAPRLGERFEIRQGLCTGDNRRFLRRPWEVPAERIPRAATAADLSRADVWMPFIKGGEGQRWFEPLRWVVCWRRRGLQIRLGAAAGTLAARPQNIAFYTQRGVAVQTLGGRFAGRLHRFPSVFGDMARTVFGDAPAEVVVMLNTEKTAETARALNPTIHVTVGDIQRLPYTPDPEADAIVAILAAAFEAHERHREPSVEHVGPGPSHWESAQAWAQQAADRPEGAPLPPYTPALVPASAEAHLSHALRHAIEHTLPGGILFIDGRPGAADSLDEPAAAPLQALWDSGGLRSRRAVLGDYLRLDFFKHVHRPMYADRPVLWPLSSAERTFVAWIPAHRAASALGVVRERLLAAQQQAPCRELSDFITTLNDCRSSGQPGGGRAVAYAPEVDDGFAVNSAPLWPLLAPQWASPRRWWLALAAGAMDWSSMAARRWPARVADRCREDPSLAAAHGRLWRDHPAAAWAWELRLQEEIGPESRIEEPGHVAVRATHVATPAAAAAVAVEARRRRGRGASRRVVASMVLHEEGVWSGSPAACWALEVELSAAQGAPFRLRAPDEAARDEYFCAHPLAALAILEAALGRRGGCAPSGLGALWSAAPAASASWLSGVSELDGDVEGGVVDVGAEDEGAVGVPGGDEDDAGLSAGVGADAELLGDE